MNDRLKILHLSNHDTNVVHLLGVLENLEQKYVRYPVYSREDYILALAEVSPDIIIADEDATSIYPAEALRMIAEKILIIPFVVLVSEVTEVNALPLLKAGAADYAVKEKLWRLPYIISSQMKQKQLTAALLQARSSIVNHSELVRKNKNLEQFTYIISHNLRAPVANIIGLTALLKDESADNEYYTDLVQGLSTSIHTMDTIIKDLNHTLQADHDPGSQREHVYFQQIVNEIESSISNLVNAANAVINCDFSDMPIFNTVRGYIYSIFYNIILNSIKYRKDDESPVICISSKVNKDQLVLTFKDNGKGIDMEKHGADLFILYKRFDTSIEGKGMGMFMVKTQVEDLDGGICLESEPGKGTNIIIHFPLHGDN